MYLIYHVGYNYYNHRFLFLTPPRPVFHSVKKNEFFLLNFSAHTSK